MTKITIGITDCGKYTNYERWILDEPAVETIRLSYHADNLSDLEKCHGIILSGGQDINPRLYKQPDFLAYTNPNDMDERRDEFEWKVLQHVEENKVPLLGICRGLQFVNVFFGGTLVPDIPAFGKFNHSKIEEGNDRIHTVAVDPYSLLCKITGQSAGEVNSAHHQSVDMPGFGLVSTAVSPDGVIEAMERIAPEGKPFLLLVQWHPERMNDPGNVFARNIKQSFLNSVRDNM